MEVDEQYILLRFEIFGTPVIAYYTILLYIIGIIGILVSYGILCITSPDKRTP